MPLQLYLRNILIRNQTAQLQGMDVEDIGTTIKYLDKKTFHELFLEWLEYKKSIWNLLLCMAKKSSR